jgi:hypothetical protein
VIPRLSGDISLIALLGEIRYTLSSLLVDPTAASLAPAFQALRTEWKAVADQEVEVLESLASAEANFEVADAALSDFAERVGKIVLQITKGDRTHALYLGFFGANSSPSLRRSAVDRDEAPESTQPWIVSLQSAPHPALRSMAPELTQRHSQAALALRALHNAEEKHKYFTQVGARSQFLDKVNAARADVYGAVSRHAAGSAGTPIDYAARFFRGVPSERSASAPPAANEPRTVDEVKARISSLKAQASATEAELVQRTTQLKRLEEEAERRAMEVELADLEKKDEELKRRRAELRERLARR